MTQVLIILLVVVVGWLVVASLLDRHSAREDAMPTATPVPLPPAPEAEATSDPSPPRLDPTAARHLAAFAAREATGDDPDSAASGEPAATSTSTG